MPKDYIAIDIIVNYIFVNSEGPQHIDDFDDDEIDSRETVIPGFSSVEDIIREAVDSVSVDTPANPDGPSIEVSEDIDSSDEDIQEAIAKEGADELAAAGEDEIADSVNFIGVDESVKMPPPDGDVSRFSEGLGTNLYYPENAESSGFDDREGDEVEPKKAQEKDSDLLKINEDIERSFKPVNRKPRDEVVIVDKESLESDIPLGVGPPLEEGVNIELREGESQFDTMPPPASIPDRLGHQVELAKHEYRIAKTRFEKAESKLALLKETLGAFYGAEEYAEVDIVAMVEDNELEKVARILPVHYGFFSENLAMVLLARRDRIQLFIDNIDSFKELGVSVVEKLAGVELSFDQITVVLKTLRKTDRFVFFGEVQKEDQVEYFVDLFLKKAEKLVEKLKDRFS